LLLKEKEEIATNNDLEEIYFAGEILARSSDDLAASLRRITN